MKENRISLKIISSVCTYRLRALKRIRSSLHGVIPDQNQRPKIHGRAMDTYTATDLLVCKLYRVTEAQERKSLSVFNTHYPPRCALKTLSHDYLACVIIRLSSWLASSVYCLLNFHSLAMIGSGFAADANLLVKKRKMRIQKKKNRINFIRQIFLLLNL